MSDRPISVGDLVQVVRPTPCCGQFSGRYPFFRVGGIKSGYWECAICGEYRTANAAQVEGVAYYADLHRLKRIPPLSELEGQRSEDARPLTPEEFSERVDKMQEELRR